MKKRTIIKRALLAVLFLFAAVYALAAIHLATSDNAPPVPSGRQSPPQTVAIFGASGTAGDGILKATLADPDVASVRVITRRITPRMEAGIEAGKVQVEVHNDYSDYAAVMGKLQGVDAVFWALGTSSVGMDEEPYRQIHVDFPARFVEQWLAIGVNPEATFHYISSSDISADSSAMWARVKVEAENTLFGLASETQLRVIAYRPDYIGPTSETAHLGQRLAYAFFAPVGAAVKAMQIGQAMIEVATRGDEFTSGDKLSTRAIHRYSDAYESRISN